MGELHWEKERGKGHFRKRGENTWLSGGEKGAYFGEAAEAK